MKRTLVVVALALLSGCVLNQAQMDAMLKDIQGCRRSYQGGTGGAGVAVPSFSFQISCEPVVQPQLPPPK